MIGTLKNCLKKIILKQKFKKHHVEFANGVTLSFSSDFGGYNKIGKNTFFSGNLGYASYIGNNCHIIADIGKYCCIAPRVVTVKGTHPVTDWVTVHPAFFSTARQCGMTYVAENKFAENDKKTVIGNDVWIGDSAIILDGVTIGDGAVIGAGAVVTKDVAPYSIVVGVPAKEIRKRFSDDEITKLLEIKWWDKPTKWIETNADKFNDLNLFFEAVFLDGEENKNEGM